MTNQQKRIAIIDCDDVLIDINRPMFDAIYKEYDKNISASKTYNLHKTLGITTEEFFDVLYENEVLEQGIVNAYANALINDLRKLNFECHMVTSRGWHKNARELTEQSLNRVGIKLDSMIFLEPGVSKAECIKENFGKATLIIDDCFKHVRESILTGAVSYGLVPLKTWNATDITDDWIEDEVDVKVRWINGLHVMPTLLELGFGD